MDKIYPGTVIGRPSNKPGLLNFDSWEQSKREEPHDLCRRGAPSFALML
jgi:hypothetical protein